jgi:excisionase family DNA binding protein
VNAKYGLEMTSFIVENVSVPPEVEQAIDKRSSMSAIGNLNDYVKFQMAQGMEKGGSSAGGMATEMAIGMAIAQQMMQQQNPAARAASETAPAALDLLSPADAAKLLGVSEQDVLDSLASGDLKGKKIGSTYRITRAALEQFLAS